MTRTELFKNRLNSLNWVSKNLYQEKGNCNVFRPDIAILFIDATQFTDKNTVCKEKISFVNQKGVF